MATSWPVDVIVSPRAVSAQVLVRLHVEPHGKQRQLKTCDQQHGDEDDRGRRDLVPEDAQDDLENAEPEARERHEHAEGGEEDERVEVADNVLLPHAPPEALEEE